MYDRHLLGIIKTNIVLGKETIVLSHEVDCEGNVFSLQSSRKTGNRCPMDVDKYLTTGLG